MVLVVILPITRATGKDASEKREFDLPDGDAAFTLRRFIEQSGEQLVYMVDLVKGVNTHAVKGEFTARETLSNMVKDTDLVIIEDSKTGALTLSRAKNEPRDGKHTKEPSGPVENRKLQTTMKTKNIVRMIGGWLAISLSSPTQAQDTNVLSRTGTGTIDGYVLNAQSDQYVEGASVSIEGSSVATLSDAEGYFRLTKVPAGNVNIRAFYTGLPPDVKQVEVLPNQTTKHNITFWTQSKRNDLVKLDAFQVSSSREMAGSALAINEQRFAPNIKSVVSTEQFGNVAEGNTAEFLKFLPGITISYTGGNARGVSIDGVPSDYVPVTIDGFNLASADGGKTNRTVMSDMVSINNLSRIEVLYTPTPESSASALAGSINMVTRSAFERASPLFQSNIYISTRDNAKNFSKVPGAKPTPTRNVYPGFDFSYIAPVSKKFGYSISAGRSTSYSPQDRSQSTWKGTGSATNGTSFPDTSFDKPYLSSYRVEDQPKITTRQSVGASADFRLSNNDLVSVGFLYTSFDVQFALHSLTYNPGKVQAGGFSNTFVRGVVGAGNVSMIHNERNRFNRTYMPTIEWKHNGPEWKGDLGLGYSQASDFNHDIDQGYFRAVNGIRSGVTVSFDNVSYLRPGTITVTDAAGNTIDPYKLANYSLTSATSQRNATHDLQKTAYGSLSRDFSTSIPLKFKAGFNFQEGQRDITNASVAYTYVGADGKASTSPVTGDDSLAAFIDPYFSQRVQPYGFSSSEAPSNRKVWEHYVVNPTYFKTNDATNYKNQVKDSKYAKEQVLAFYLRADVSTVDQRLKIIGGVRGEKTKINAQGPLTDPTNSLIYLERGAKVDNKYSKLYPSLNISYNLQSNLIGRIAYYESIGRPDYNQYAGGVTLPDTSAASSSTNRIVVNNVDIDPWSAKSVVARIEYYFEGVGVVSVSAYRREIKNFFGSQIRAVTPEFLALYGLDSNTYSAYDISTQYNIPGTVSFEGLSFNYRQSLTFLPNWASGIEIFANGSTQRSIGDTGGNFAGYIPRSGSAGLSLTREKFNVRVNINYRSRTRLNEVAAGKSIELGTYAWEPSSKFLDIVGEYNIRKNLSIYFNLRNVGDQGSDSEIYGPSTPENAKFRQSTKYGSLWTFGVNWSH